MPEQILKSVAQLIGTAQGIAVRSTMVAKMLQAMEIVLTQGVDEPEKSQDACLAGLEILKSLHYQQALMDEEAEASEPSSPLPP